MPSNILPPTFVQKTRAKKKKKKNKTHPLSQGVEGALGSAWEILEAR